MASTRLLAVSCSAPPDAQPHQACVRPGALQDLERVRRPHRPARAGLEHEHLKGLVGAAVRIQERRGHRGAGHGWPAEVAQGAQKGLADLEAGAVVALAEEPPDHRAAFKNVLALEHLLRRRRLHRPAAGPGREEQQEEDESQRQRGRPEAPAPHGPPGALDHHSASQQ